MAVSEILAGNMPGRLRKMVPVRIEMRDSATGRRLSAIFYVTADYLAIGPSANWARIPLTPMAAQRIADSFHCYLPTPRLVDAIYQSAKVKLEPVPMYAYRDSTPTLWQHHLIIEGQREGRNGLIAGIKKDVVVTSRLLQDARGHRVAIYGWHRLNGKPIQPLYTGHVDWYVDYSHGIRLVWHRVKVNGRWMEYEDVLKHPLYHQLITDEPVPLARYPKQ
ncbi:MAG: hypothetical protein QM781_06755 [Chitinophagaceae bacterium]